MTKETRVGLLVGLVIVIVFGMILTEFKGTGAPLENFAAQPVVEPDYYRVSEPPQQDLAFSPSPREAGHTVHLAATEAPAPTEPAPPVRIRVLPRTPAAPPPTAAAIRPPEEEAVEPPSSPAAPQPVRLDPRYELAQTPTERPAATSALSASPAAPAPASATPTARTYRVEPGDTLMRIAVKSYGPDKAHLYRLIYEANRDRIAGESSIAVGQELVIPPLPASAASPAAAPAPREVDLAGLQQFTQHPRTENRRVYIVQSGDSLTRIARKLYNDDSRNAVNRLFEANKDKLQDRNSIRQGMTLRVPS